MVIPDTEKLFTLEALTEGENPPLITFTPDPAGKVTRDGREVKTTTVSGVYSLLGG